MRKILSVFLAILFIAAAAGCQSTPEESVVIGKGDGQLEEKIAAQTDTALPSDMPGSGTHIEETYRHDSLDITIEVDAIVDTQDGRSMPAAKVAPHRFTQAEVDAVYEHYVGGAHFFCVPDGEAWSFGTGQSIAEIEARLEFAKTNGDGAEFIERLENNLAEARRNYLTAKDASEFPEVTHILNKENLVFGGDLTEGVYGFFEKNDAAYLFSAVNDGNGMSSEMSLQRIRKDDRDESIYEEILGIGPKTVYLGAGESLREIPYDDALTVAQDTVSAFGARDMALAHAEAKQYPEGTLESYYIFIFTHEVNGVPCKYDATGIANDEGYNDIWDYEQLIVRMDAHGLKSAIWRAPCDITEQLAESTAMIPFEEVMNCFSKMVFIKNSYLESDIGMVVRFEDGAPHDDGGGQDIEGGLTVGSVVVHIDRITLGLMRVQSGMDYLLIPVWDFYGYKEILTPEGEDLDRLIYENSNERFTQPYRVYEICLLTINAIDGSVIDRSLGY